MAKKKKEEVKDIPKRMGRPPNPNKPPKKEKGRPSKYTKPLAMRICTELMKGRTLRAICREAGMPAEWTVRNWAKDDYMGFYSQYARARDIGLDAMAEELFDIADDGSSDWMTIGPEGAEYEVENKEVTNRSKLRVETRKWYLSKLAAKRYGDKLLLSGDEEQPVRIQIVDDISPSKTIR